jgi:hypothetical protein
LYGAETLTLWEVHQKCLESFELWCWRRKKIGPTVRNKKVLQTVKEERNILHTIKRQEANWIAHIETAF